MSRYISFHLILFLSLVASISLSAQTNNGDISDWSLGEYMREATDNVFEKASLLNALSEYTFNDNLCLAGAILETGETIQMDMILNAGQSYTLIGSGDSDVIDLDMYVLDRNGVTVASDVEDDDTPIPDFTAAYDGKYSIYLQLVSGDAPTSFVSFAILSPDGTTIEEENFAQTSDIFFKLGSYIHDQSTGVKWHDLTNQWSFFGLLMNNQTAWDFDNLRLGSENHVLYASGSDNVQNIDLILTDDQGVRVASDLDNDATPIFNVKTLDERRYSLKIMNTKSQGKSLILMGIVSE